MQTYRLIRAYQGGVLSGCISQRYLRRWLVAFIFLGLVFAPAVARAALLSESYTASSSLPIGSIVSLQKGSTSQVDSATTNTADYIFGVTVNGSDSQLSISSSQNNQVSVATDGIEQVLVSDINGDISAGEPITASPINGVGMKATSSVKIIGVARDSFPNSTAKKQSYKDEKGQQQSVMIGQVPVLINVAYYYKQPDKTIIPSVLQSLANALAGKKVNPLPILISLGIFIVTMIIVVSIVYSMIHSSIISVGRNPLSQAAVYRNVIQLSGLVILLLGVAVGSIYMILTRL
jgi:hypothetical protein